jgi:hypothetical protein
MKTKNTDTLLKLRCPNRTPPKTGETSIYIFSIHAPVAAGAYDGPELLAASGWNNEAGLSLAKSFTQTQMLG